MKKVFSSASDVIHLYAQRTQSEGRSGNVFFDHTDYIYSYGHHYLLGEFITNSNGDLAIMINDKGYSVSTAKHINWLRQATRQYKQFFTEQTKPESVLRNLTTLANKLQSAKKPELYINPAEEFYTKFIEFQQWNGKSTDFVNVAKIEKLIEVFRGAKYSDYLAEQAAIIKKAEAKKQRELKAQFRKELKDFFDYKRDRLNYSTEDYLRIAQDGQSVETTQRVTVPIKEATTLYKLIKAGHDIKGFNISGYTVISLNGQLKIGCHHINLQNMHEVGEKLLTM